MSAGLSLDDLWDAPSPQGGAFYTGQLLDRPEAARSYLEHAIAPGTHLASAVRLRMHGEIKLGRWLPFTAEQVIRRDRGMIWRASASRSGIPIRGSDRLVDGVGSMQWKLFGIFPVMVASGADITRASVGRVQVESIWLPPVLCDPAVLWTEADKCHPHAHFTTCGETTDLELTLQAGRVTAAALPRWGNPEGAAFHYVSFGGIVDAEGLFQGYTIPTRIRVGWYFGTARFESEGEFFRVTIDHAEFR